MQILILGGTIFLGRHVTQAALAGGHEVVHFNRGRHGPELYPELERIRGDRDGGLDALRGRARITTGFEGCCIPSSRVARRLKPVRLRPFRALLDGRISALRPAKLFLRGPLARTRRSYSEDREPGRALC